MLLTAALVMQQELPAPTGHVNDFANVIPADTRARLEDLARRVQAATAGDIAVVTLPDLGGRPVEEVALRIGREWRLGADSAIGSRARNAGVVILVVPKETSSDGSGYCRIEVGQGAEGFITDATSGRICREAVPLFAQQDYGAAIEYITVNIAQRFAEEFGVTLDGVPPRRTRAPPSPQGGMGTFLLALFIIFLVMMIMSRIGGRSSRRGCVGCVPVPMGGPPIIIHGGHRGGWGGGGFGGGGFGGGGFGGFGGGGGFSGGGGGARW